MSKRKRGPRPTPDESTDDASVKDDMVHVTPDLLAGSPDIFASKKPSGAGVGTTAVPEYLLASVSPPRGGLRENAAQSITTHLHFPNLFARLTNQSTIRSEFD